MNISRHKKNVYFLRPDNPKDEKEKKWDQRFILDKIPPYDAYKDVNYLSLGLIKSKIRYENILEKERIKRNMKKNPFLTVHYALESQPMKNNIETHNFTETSNDKHKKLIFTINNISDKNKNIDPRKTHSFSHSHRFYKSKTSVQSNFDNKFIRYKFKDNYIQKSTKLKISYDNNPQKELTIEESDLLEEFVLIKEMWNKFGVTKKYQENFIEFINSLEKNQSIKQFLYLEKKQMQKFKFDLTQLLKKIINSNNKIENLKNLITIYSNILNEKNYFKEKKDEKLQSLNEINENKIISQINDSLLSLRLHTINVINQIKNFSLANSYYFYMNKIDLNNVKNEFFYNDEYLLTIKNDLDFVQNSVIQNLYEFHTYGGCDPFFLSFTKFPEKGEQSNDDINNDNNNELEEEMKKKELPINDKLLNEIQNCLCYLNQAEILNRTKNN